MKNRHHGNQRKKQTEDGMLQRKSGPGQNRAASCPNSIPHEEYNPPVFAFNVAIISCTLAGIGIGGAIVFLIMYLR
jgi:hypothetical protein